jgi:hypothetical protein
MQPIDSSGITEQSLITNKMVSICSVTPAKPICHAMHALPIAVSRLNLISFMQKPDNNLFFFTLPWRLMKKA